MTVDNLSEALRRRMDQKYRYQRHLFDLTRRFFLFGRDKAIDALAPSPADVVLEIGCGTGRNLVALAQRSLCRQLIGIDISTEMLKSAEAQIARKGIKDHVRLVQADATHPIILPDGWLAPNKILMSYSLSMIPDWRAGLRAAVDLLPVGGRLHIVDFGDFATFGSAMSTYAISTLGRHDAPPCLGLAAALPTLGGNFRVHHAFGPCRYYQLATIEKVSHAD